MRVAIIGDIGGHVLALTEQFAAVGVDVDRLHIPSDLVICQVGDLVHKGPESAAVVSLVDALMRANPDQWVQLLGNHEAQYTAADRTFWAPAVDEPTASILRRWWETGHMRIAANFTLAIDSQTPDAVDASPGGQLLVTHAGLTCGAFRNLGEPPSVTDLVNVLNAAQDPTVWRDGAMLTGVTDPGAGPLWAAAASEVYGSWAAYNLDGLKGPGTVFHQAHGHTSAMSWRIGNVYPPLETLQRRDDVSFTADPHRKITRTMIKGRVFFGVDPQSGVTPSTVTRPLVLPITAGQQD